MGLGMSTPSPLHALRSEDPLVTTGSASGPCALPRESAERPQLFCPFPAAIHPNADVIEARAVAWAVAIGLAPSERAREKLASAKVGRLVARANPTGSFERVALAADWTTFFCALDDRIEPLSPTGVTRALAELTAVLHGAPARPGDVLQRAVEDVASRLEAVTTLDWRARFLNRVQQLFAMFAIEAEVRAAGRPASLADYVPMREVTVGVHVELCLSELIAEVNPTEEERSILAPLARTASNLVGWANDVFTYEKELAAGDPNNLIAVIAAGNVSIQEAAERAVRMHDRAALELATSLEGLGRAASPALRRYAAILAAWVRGHLDWARETGRYVT
jgi:5-epi-alpha-selinene synthase